MTIEQKAQRYDEAIKLAKDSYSYPSYPGFIRADVVFPELKESEDEKIISAIRKALESKVENLGNGVTRTACLAWLEKQTTPQVRTGLEWENTIDDACDARYAEEYSHDEYCHEQSFKWGFKEGVEWLEKQGEQKPYDNATIVVHHDFTPKSAIEAVKEEKVDNATKVEPKFKVGDWIIFNGLILHIDEAKNGFYTTTSNNGIHNSYDWSIDNIAKFWTIVDANVGDVLANKNGAIFINAGNNRYGGTLDCYCYLSVQNKFCIEEHKTGSWLYKDDIKPATKEQRDALMQAMADAGYTFDFEKKELKKIEQKPAEWHREDEQNLNACLGYIPDEFLRRWLTDIIHVKYDKLAWSEEDEKKVNNLCVFLDQMVSFIMLGNKDCTKFKDWLKSLKDRIQPQSKQEWSEEDEERLRNTINCLAVYKEDTDVRRSQSTLNDVIANIDWLRSLRPREMNKWRKEDEYIINGVIGYLKETDADKNKGYINWLKSLRPQQKQEWSENDQNIMCFLVNVTEDYKLRNGFSSEITKGDKAIDWLKSIKDRVQPQTKPFKEVYSQDQIDEVDRKIIETKRQYDAKLFDAVLKAKDFPMTD